MGSTGTAIEDLSSTELRAELLRRAHALAPQVGARAAEAEQARRLPAASIAELADAGLFSLLVPERLGGLQTDLATLTGVARTLARGCASTAWVTSFFGLHGWLLALMGPAATDTLFAEHPYVLAPGAFSPGGRAETVDGGYVLSGRWPWATGVLHSDWVMLAGIVATPDGPPDLRVFVLPIDQVGVDDTWHTDGMRATGSNDITVDGVSVPAELTLSFRDIVNGCPTGDPPYGDPLYGLPLVPTLCVGAAAPLLGVAEGVLDAYHRRLSERVLAQSGGRVQKDVPAARTRLAEATVTLRSAQLVFEEAVARLDGVRGGAAPLDLADRVRLRWQTAWVVGVCRRLVNELCAASGASAHRLASPLQRAKRDLDTGAGHVVFDLDVGAELYGLHALDLDLPPNALV